MFRLKQGVNCFVFFFEVVMIGLRISMGLFVVIWILVVGLM